MHKKTHDSYDIGHLRRKRQCFVHMYYTGHVCTQRPTSMNTEVSSAEKDDAYYISVASERNLRRVRFLKETDDSYYRGLVATVGGSGLLFVHVTHVSVLPMILLHQSCSGKRPLALHRVCGAKRCMTRIMQVTFTKRGQRLVHTY